MKVFVIFGILITLTAAANEYDLPEKRILGGRPAKDGQFPYQILLRISGGFYCGGCILNKRWVLTAAHCVQEVRPSMLQVVVGTNNFSSGGDSFNVEKIFYHEKYNDSYIQNDIALIKVDQDIKFNDKIKPIKLFTDYVGAGKELIATGWGWNTKDGIFSERLQFINLNSISLSDCKKKGHKILVQKTKICTLTKNGKGICFGDSGGPLVYDDDGVYKVVGITSHIMGEECGSGYPDVFTRVSSYVDWIQSHMDV